MNSRFAMAAAALPIMVIVLAGCAGKSPLENTAFGDSTSGLNDEADIQYYPSDKLVALGKNQFKAGNYGLAQKAYQQAVEVYPNDAEAWLGLAASYDRLHRFDQADIAYRKLAKMIPRSPEYYNNLGFSYMLRGKLAKARRYFLKAYEIDPSDERVRNNLAMLRASVKYAKRG